VWTISSFEIARNECREDQIWKIVNSRYSEADSKTTVNRFIQIQDSDEVPMPSDEAFREWLMTNEYYSIADNDSIWVDGADPTVICVDESKFPYDLKNGWSDRTVSVFIHMWMVLLGLYCGPVRLKTKDGFSSIRKKTSIGLAQMELGQTSEYKFDDFDNPGDE
jgi:hypothetical protein